MSADPDDILLECGICGVYTTVEDAGDHYDCHVALGEAVAGSEAPITPIMSGEE